MPHGQCRVDEDDKRVPYTIENDIGLAKPFRPGDTNVIEDQEAKQERRHRAREVEHTSIRNSYLSNLDLGHSDTEEKDPSKSHERLAVCTVCVVAYSS